MDELVMWLTLIGIAVYVLTNLIGGLWYLIRSGASPEEVEDALDRLAEAAEGRPRGHDPTLYPDGEYDGSKGVWCDWCWRYHDP